MRRSLFVVVSAVASLPAVAFAHTVAVDGNPADWTLTAPPTANTGIIRRNALFEGAFVWNDPTGDERTDFTGGAADARVDVDTFSVTSDTTNLYFLVRMLDIDLASGDGAPQVQIAIDLDGVAGSGNVNFFGFADTTVAAPWEYLVRTSFGSGGPVALFNAAGFDVAVASTAAIDATTETIEIAIPWAELVSAAVGPTAPIRFTVATFRANGSDNTWDITDTSNALDVVSNYGDPAFVPPNTFTEVSDGDVDYHFQVFFHVDPNREPSAPLLISEALPDGVTPEPGTEWIEIVNVTGAAIPLAGYRLGDEEQVDPTAGVEGMLTFPTADIVAGGAVVVANDAITFAGVYLTAPDFEMVGASALIPNLTSDPTWSTGTVSLVNGGDQVLLLDPYYTILDVLTWGTATFSGITAAPVPPQSNSLVRTPSRSDTDNCAVDFVVTALLSPGAVAGPCLAEGGGFVADGTPCEDGLACIAGSTCTTGVCGGGTAVTCPADTNPCTMDVCVEAANGCYGPSIGTPCDDGLNCTTATACDINAACTGTAVVCPVPTSACELAVCDETTLCDAAAGTACDDLDMCTSGDTCDGAGTCLPDAILVCNDGNGCTDDSCAPASGCVFAPNTDPCSDGSACTSGDVCAGGICAGAPVVCDDGNVCTDDSCDATTGCVTSNNTAPCTDGNACTVPDACAGGACVPGAPLVCDDGNVCTDDACAPATGCVTTDNTAPCDDGSLCTSGDACSGGSCSGGTAVVCPDDGNVCTDEACVPATGLCASTNNTAPCSDDSACTTGDACSGGACAPGAPLTCNDGNVCTADSCAPATGCVFDPAPANGTGCDDGLFCTTGSLCMAGACGGGTATSCTDANACTIDSCDETTDQCVFDAAGANGDACDDSLFCTTGTTCSGGTCTGGSATSCADTSACTVDSCDEGADTCVNASAPLNGSPCDDGVFCTVGEVCTAGACAGGTPNPCADLEGCTTDSCNTTTQACQHTPVANGTVCAAAGGCFTGGTCTAGTCSAVTPAPAGTTCDDADLCTSGDVCDGSGTCGGAAVTCDDMNACTADACNPASGCTFADEPDGTACDDGLFCTTVTTCTAGACGGGLSRNCDDANECTADSCDEAGDVCDNDATAADGAACSDGDPCTTGDVCSAGACSGTPVPGCITDAGTDAGADSGVPGSDSAVPGSDSAVPGTDGAMPADAGPDAGDLGSIRGGGCGACAVSARRPAGPTSGGAALVLLLAAAVALLRRGRRGR